MLELLAPLAGVLSWSGEAAPKPREPCPATALWESMAEEVPDTKENRRLHRRIAWGLETARHADSEPDELLATSRCLESVLGYGDAAYVHHYGTERADVELRRADEAARGLRSRYAALLAVVPPRPRPSPQDLWARRHRRLVAHTSVSAAFTSAALLVATVPWIYRATSCSDPKVIHGGCAPEISAAVATEIAIPVGLAAGVALGIWASRLARHRRASPPGLTWPGSLVRLAPTAGGIRLSF